MALTKPAGCFLQLVGAAFLLGGVAALVSGAFFVFPLVGLVMGGALLMAGRQTG